MSVDVNQMLIYHTSEWLSSVPEMIISTSRKWLSQCPRNDYLDIPEIQVVSYIV